MSSRLPSPSGVFFSLSRKIRNHADVVLVDLREVQDALFLFLVVRRGVERALVAALREGAVRRIATQLEREDTRDIRGERQRLEIEHQLHVLGERIGHADRRARQLARFAAAVVRLDLLNAPLDLAHVVEIVVRAGRDRRRRAPSCMRPIEVVEPVEDAAILGAALLAVGRASRRRRTADRTPRADRESSAAAVSGDDQLIESV